MLSRNSLPSVVFFTIILPAILAGNLPAVDLADRIERHKNQIFLPVSEEKVDFISRTVGEMASGFDDLLVSESTAPASFTQENSTIAEFNDNRAVVIWKDNRTGVSSLYGQIIGVDGNPVGGNVLLAASGNGYNLIEPKAIKDNLGGFYLAWRVLETGKIYAGRFGSSLNPVVSPFLASDNSSGSFAGPFNIEATGDGKLIVVWEHYKAGNFIGLRIFNSSGSAISSVITINDDGGSAGHWVPDVAVSGTGIMMVVWEDYRNGRADIMAQTVNSSGILEGSNFGVVEAASDDYNQFLPAVDFSLRDGFAIAWLDNRGSYQDVYLQRFVIGQNLVGGNVKISEAGNTYDNWDVSLGVNSAYNLTAVWSTDEFSDRIMARNFGADFAPSGNPYGLNITLPGSRWSPSLGFGQSDRILCAWTDMRNGLADIYLEYATSSGALLYTGDRLINGDSQGANSLESDMALAGSSVGVIVFTDQRFDVGDIFVQRVDNGGNRLGSNLKANADDAGILQNEPAVAAVSGKILVVWNDSRAVKGITGNRIFGRYLSSDGNWLGMDFLISDSNDVSAKRTPDVAMSSDGAALVVWEDYRHGLPHIYGRLYNASGDAVGGEFAVSTVGTDIDNTAPNVGADASDNFWVVWSQGGHPGGAVVNVARYNVSGILLGRFEYFADIYQLAAAVSATGHVYLFWSKAAANSDLFLTVLDGSGLLLNPDFPIIGTSDYSPLDLSISIDNQGIALLSWTDNRNGSRRAYYQIIAANYNRIGATNAVSDISGAVMTSPCMVGRDAVGWLAWSDNREEGFNVFIRQIAYSTVGVDDGVITQLPGQFQLMQNCPNPFNPATTIGFSLVGRSRVSIEIIDISGRQVLTLIDRVYDAGEHAVEWDGRDFSGRNVSSGVYLYRMIVDGHTESRKMMLLK